MVDLSGGSSEGGPYEHKFDNWIFVGPAILVVLLVGFFASKLIRALKEKEMKRLEKKKLKQQKKETGGSATASIRKKK